MDAEKVKEQLNYVLDRERVPQLNVLDYEEAHELYAYVTVRDTLLHLGVPFFIAERLASTHKGAPRKRLMSCVEHLK